MLHADKNWDVFISHASEDKENLVRPLASILAKAGVNVWYDEFALSIGDSLCRSIDKGLSKSKHGIVVLSKHFLSKNWPEYELRGLVAKEIDGVKTILPLWHGITKKELLDFSPSLADKFALSTDGKSIEQIALLLIKEIRPDLQKRITQKAAYDKMRANAEIEFIPSSKISFGPKLHETLPPRLLGRIRLIRTVLWSVYPHSMDYWINGFLHDAHPTSEIEWWEHLSACFSEVSNLFFETHEQRNAGFSLLFAICNGLDPEILQKDLSILGPEVSSKLIEMAQYRAPIFDIAETFPKDMRPIDPHTAAIIDKYGIDHFDD